MVSDKQNWNRLQELFHLAQAAAVGDRGRLLAEACPEPDLRAHVLTLIAAFEQGETANRATRQPAEAGRTGAIGPYVLRQFLGAGGMGSVYLVEREAGGIRQRAALKILAAEAMDAPAVDRFHREERVLASLDHPFITRVLDAGLSDTGQPYLVMEYVEGRRLDSWCDEKKAGIDERLRLFLRVCDAVDHAHRNLVVHLDLKPSNILVTAGATPKLLDFGTAKLNIDGRLTTTLHSTPFYASPEQLRNEAVTTACDIYSLGVILYELLAGKRPSGEASIAALIEQAIEEREPVGPVCAVTAEAAANRGLPENRLRALLAGDLSTIVCKCLRAKPRDRYGSVRALADDIERYLSGRPVLARPQTTFYRLRKFVRRNRGKLAALTVIAAALAASLGSAWWGEQRALREGRRAIQMQAFLYRLFAVASSNDTGKPATTVQDLLMLGVKVLPEYIRDAGDRRSAELCLAEALFWNGDTDGARKLWMRVAETATAAGDTGSEAEALAFLGRIAFNDGDQDRALSQSARSLTLSRRGGVSPRTRMVSAVVYTTIREDLGKRTDENLGLMESAVRDLRENGFPSHEKAQTLYYLGSFLANRGRLQEAEAKYREALGLCRESLVHDCTHGLILHGIASLKARQALDQESAEIWAQAQAAFAQCRGPESTDTLRLRALRAGALARTGRLEQAIPVLEEILPVCRKVIPPGHIHLLEELDGLSFSYIEARRWRDAERLAVEGLGIAEGKTPADHKWRGRMHLLVGLAMAGQSRHREALPHLEEAGRILRLQPDAPAVRADAAKLAAALERTRASLAR